MMRLKVHRMHVFCSLAMSCKGDCVSDCVRSVVPRVGADWAPPGKGDGALEHMAGQGTHPGRNRSILAAPMGAGTPVCSLLWLGGTYAPVGSRVEWVCVVVVVGGADRAGAGGVAECT